MTIFKKSKGLPVMFLKWKKKSKSGNIEKNFVNSKKHQTSKLILRKRNNL